MARRKKIKPEAPKWLIQEYTIAKETVDCQLAHGDPGRTIWNDILDRTKKALEDYGYFDEPVVIEPEDIGGSLEDN